MKIFLRFAVLLVFMFSLGCQKESGNSPIAVSPTTIVPPLPNSTTSIGTVYAGRDIFIDLPEDSCLLNGSVQFPENIHSQSWSKISGPPAGTMQHATLLETTINSLAKGNYKYELRIIDRAGVTLKDTVAVFVSERGSGINELIFANLQWNCPMGCHLRIQNFPLHIPSNTSFRVFVKRDNSILWTEAVEIHQPFSKYMWTIYNNGLEIVEDQTELDPNDTPDVKITF